MSVCVCVWYERLTTCNQYCAFHILTFILQQFTSSFCSLVAILYDGTEGEDIVLLQSVIICYTVYTVYITYHILCNGGSQNNQENMVDNKNN